MNIDLCLCYVGLAAAPYICAAARRRLGAITPPATRVPQGADDTFSLHFGGIAECRRYSYIIYWSVIPLLGGGLNRPRNSSAIRILRYTLTFYFRLSLLLNLFLYWVFSATLTRNWNSASSSRTQLDHQQTLRFDYKPPTLRIKPNATVTQMMKVVMLE